MYTDSEYADMSIQACPPSPAFEPSCSLSHSQRRAPGFTPVDWNVDPGKYMNPLLLDALLLLFLHIGSNGLTLMSLQRRLGGLLAVPVSLSPIPITPTVLCWVFSN